MLNDQDYDDYLLAGKIAGKAREFGANLIKVNASVEEVLDKVEEFIQEQGGQMAFPAQISLNQTAAHYCSPKDDPLRFKPGDLAKIDVGVHINGMIGDTAKTVDLGEHKNVTQASLDALNNVLKNIHVGITNSEIGSIIETSIRKLGCVPVSNLSGHGLDKYKIHCSPGIPNFDTQENFKIKPGMTFAVEPFASTGAGFVIDGHDAEVFMLQNMKSVRSPITRTILTQIKTYNGLPFCSRWLANKFGMPKTNFALRELLNQDIIRMYPPLSDKAKGMVSQHEHSFLAEEDKIIVTTK